MIFDDFQKTNFAFRGLSDEEPEEKEAGGLPEDDGDSDLEPGKFEEEEEKDGEVNPE
jgi:hypothetical protein